ncbi:INO80 complex subunit C [Copidosoma floridanum]|uniref:INO80 complex subunit C n=1 Tax=Copidosoma floridanum TaxID=29053 RepID=UPI0006C96EAF|nr:INO80 complex subunit C [Copidosoma floridanum]
MVLERSNDDLNKRFFFKNANFRRESRIINYLNKKKMWKSLKQIIAQEIVLQWQLHSTIHYSWISMVALKKPVIKYSDFSGLSASYTDPLTKLNYANTDEFTIIRNLPMNITAGYLTLRGASCSVG